MRYVQYKTVQTAWLLACIVFNNWDLAHERTSPKWLPLRVVLGRVTTEVVCIVVSCQNLSRKLLGSRWLLRFVISPICCLFSQFQWITYDAYYFICHPNAFVAQEHFWICCQIELSTSLYDASFMFEARWNNSRLLLRNHFGNPNPVSVSCARSLLFNILVLIAWKALGWSCTTYSGIQMNSCLLQVTCH